MIPQERIDRTIELLKLCQRLQCEKDGVDRGEPLAIDKGKVLDRFAQDIDAAIVAQATLGKYARMVERLNALGQALHGRGEVDVKVGDHFSDAALDHVMRHFGVDVEPEAPAPRGR